MEEKIFRISEWMNGKKAPPMTMELNVTNNCNLKCLSCWQRGTKVDCSSEMSEEEWIKIVEDAGKMGVKEVRLPGSGEPMMRKKLVLGIAERAKKFGMNGLLITNGTCFDAESIKKIVGIGWDNVTFSVDGPDAETSDYLRGMKGAFEKSTKAIKEFVEWKVKLKKSKPLLRLNVVLSNKNYDKLDRMMELAYRLKCEAVSVQPMTVFSRVGEKLKLNGRQVKELPMRIKKARKVADELNVYTNVDSFLRPEVVEKANEMDEVIESEVRQIGNKFLSLPCFEPWYNLVIMPDGTAGPCSIFGGADGENVRNKNLEEVWYGGYFNKIRERLLNKHLFHFCKNCCVVVFEENKRLRNELMRRVSNG